MTSDRNDESGAAAAHSAQHGFSKRAERLMRERALTRLDRLERSIGQFLPTDAANPSREGCEESRKLKTVMDASRAALDKPVPSPSQLAVLSVKAGQVYGEASRHLLEHTKNAAEQCGHAVNWITILSLLSGLEDDLLLTAEMWLLGAAA